MELLWILLIVGAVLAVWAIVARDRGVVDRETVVVRRRPRRRRRVVEREVIEPAAGGGERRVVEREAPDDRLI